MALLKRKRVGLNDAMEVVTKFVNACNRHDADGVSACLHPDFDSIQPMYPSRNFRGAEQVRRNWQAIFDAEPGFRLTVLRSAAMDDTVWLELHGAGRDAEVAGIFIMGIVGDRIRWARIYSALVEPVPAGAGEPPAPLQDVARSGGTVVNDDGELVEHELIAPVLDMERSTRRRRRRRAEADAAAGGGEALAESGSEADAAAEPEDFESAAEAAAPEIGGEAVAVVDVVAAEPSYEEVEVVAVVETEVEAVALVEAGVEPVAVVEAVAEPVNTETDAGPIGTETDVAPAPAPAVDETEAEPVETEVGRVAVVEADSEPVAIVVTDAEPIAVVETDGELVGVVETDGGLVGVVETHGEPMGVVETDGEPVGVVVTDAEPVGVVETGGEPVAIVVTDGEPVAVVETDAEPAPAADDGLDTEAHPLIVWDDGPEAEPDADAPSDEEAAPAVVEAEARPEPPRRRFGKRSRG